MKTYDHIHELTDDLGPMYDDESICMDYESNNFNLDNYQDEVERYFKPNIVATSLINGQIKQAKQQYVSYGLSFSDMQSTGLTDGQITVIS